MENTTKFVLEFVYKGRGFEVSQEAGEEFGGMGVSPNGYYKKTDDAKPNIDD